VVSVGLYLLALLLPGLVPDAGVPWSEHAEAAGYVCLLFGPLSWTVDPVMTVAWSANLVYFALLLLAETIPPEAGIVPFLIGLASLGVKTNVTGIESGPRVAVHLGAGGWLWLASLLVFAPVPFLKRSQSETGSNLG